MDVYSPNSFNQNRTIGTANASKSFVKWVVFLLILALIGVGIYWFIIKAGKSYEAKLVSKTGTVQLRENDKGDWKEISSLPLVIPVGGEIRTLDESAAQLELGDGSIIRLSNLSHLVLIANKGEYNWVQTDGNAHYQIAKNPERKRFNVAFSEGEVQALGTAFEIKIQDGDTNILVLENKVNFSSKDKTNQEIKAGEKGIINLASKRVNEIEESDLKDDWTMKNLEQDTEKKLVIDDNLLVKAGLKEKTEETSESDNSEEESQTSEKNDNTNSTEITEVDSNSGSNGESEDNKDKESSSSDISLEAKKSDNGVLLNWSGGSEDRESWKVLKGDQSEIFYPNDAYRTVPKDSKSYLWEITGDVKTYYFKVCAFKENGGCVGYSNVANIESGGSSSDSSDSQNSNTNRNNTNTNSSTVNNNVATRGKCENSGGHWNQNTSSCTCPPGKSFKDAECRSTTYANNVSLTANQIGNDASLSWSIKDGDAPYGYKVFVGKSPGTQDSSKYFTKENTKNYTWKNLKKGNTYYFRVCIYDGNGSCTKYSAEKKIKIPKS